jgi:hypothetical protein
VLYEEKENGKGTPLVCFDLRSCPSGWLLFQEADHIETGCLRLEGAFSASNGQRQTSVCGGKPETSNGEVDQRQIHVLPRRKKSVRMVC